MLSDSTMGDFKHIHFYCYECMCVWVWSYASEYPGAEVQEALTYLPPPMWVLGTEPCSSGKAVDTIKH